MWTLRDDLRSKYESHLIRKCHSFGVKMTHMRPLGDGSAADLPDGDTFLWLGGSGKTGKVCAW